jgi:hypothetical protein
VNESDQKKRVAELLATAREAHHNGESARAVEVLRQAMSVDPERATPQLVSTLMARGKAAMWASVEEAVVLYREAHDLDPSASKPLVGLVQSLVKRSLELTKAGALDSSRQALEEAVNLASEVPEVVRNGVTDLRLVAALRLLGEKCLVHSGGKSVSEAALLLERTARGFGWLLSEASSLLWMASSVALENGESGRAQEFAASAEELRPQGSSVSRIAQSQLTRRARRGTRVLVDRDTKKRRELIHSSVAAVPSATVFVTSQPTTATDHADTERTPPAVSPLSADKHFETARRVANESIDELHDLLPELFDPWLPAIDLQRPYTYLLTLRLALREIPEILAFVADVSKRGAHAVLVDPLLGDASLKNLLRVAGLEVPPGGLDLRYSEGALPSRILGVDSQPRTRQEQRASAPRGGALILVGSDVELPFLLPISEILAESGPVTFVGKEDTPASRRALAELAHLGETITAKSMRRARVHMGQGSLPPEVLERLDEQVQSLSPRLRGFVRVHLSGMRAVARTAIGFSRLIEQTAPEIVVGSLDRSLFGVLAVEIQKEGRFHTVNLQHGTVMPKATSDLLRFDLSLAWNEWSRAITLRDGYPAECLIEIVGNPRWDALSHLSGEELGSAGEELAAWKGSDRLVAIFPQPAKGPFISEETIEAIYQWIARWAGQREDLKLVVKHRSAGDDPELPVSLRDATYFRSFSAPGISLEEVLANADVAVSGYSTALLDAIAAGVPAVSADPGANLSGLPLDLLAIAQPCDSYSRFSDAMDTAISNKSLVLEDIPPDVLPRFDEPYETRISTVLRAHGLIR